MLSTMYISSSNFLLSFIYSSGPGFPFSYTNLDLVVIFENMSNNLLLQLESGVALYCTHAKVAWWESIAPCGITLQITMYLSFFLHIIIVSFILFLQQEWLPCWTCFLICSGYQTVNHNAYHEDPYAREFGIRIDERLASVEARVLPPPRVSSMF